MKIKKSAFWMLLVASSLTATTGCNYTDLQKLGAGGASTLQSTTGQSGSNADNTTTTKPKKDKKQPVPTEESSVGDLKSRFGGDKRDG